MTKSETLIPTSKPSSFIPRESGVILILLIFSFCLLLVASRDGWLRMPVGYCDTGWFFMAGKAMMEGMVPYQDFTDSKGPLLWLIYGLGSLISPHNLHGVFWFEVLFYWLNFFILYKAAKLILGDTPRSLLVSMAMALVYFYPGMHYEVITEDFCHVFNSLTLYVILQTFHRHHYKSSYAFWLGICCGCTLMIKYSYLATLLVPVFFLFLYILLRQQPLFMKSLGLLLAGFAVVCSPFVIYLAAIGGLDDFIREYFVNTPKTMVNVKAIVEAEHPGIFQRWPFNIWYLFRIQHFMAEYARLSLLAILITIYKFRYDRWVVLSMVAWYLFCILMFSSIMQDRYFLSMGIFFFGGILSVMTLIPRLSTFGAVLGGAVVTAMLSILLSFYVYSEFYYMYINIEGNKTKERIASIVNMRELELRRKPTITFLGTGNLGEVNATNTLPGTRYWSMQYGMTPEMMKSHVEDVFTVKPDFVVTGTDRTEWSSRLEEAGYVLVTEYDPSPAKQESLRDPRRLYLYPLNTKR